MLQSSKCGVVTPLLGPPRPHTRTARTPHVIRASAEHVQYGDASIGRRGVLLGSAAIASGLILPGARAAEGSAYDFTVHQYGEPVSLDRFRGQVTVVLNIASA